MFCVDGCLCANALCNVYIVVAYEQSQIDKELRKLADKSVIHGGMPVLQQQTASTSTGGGANNNTNHNNNNARRGGGAYPGVRKRGSGGGQRKGRSPRSGGGGKRARPANKLLLIVDCLLFILCNIN